MKLKKIKIKGFRSFGADIQELDLSESANFIWGGNSQGKTSLTEALEFLLTGSISRRDILSSSKDEFANSLKNAFLSENELPFVELTVGDSEKETIVKRELLEDYGKKNDCKTKLLINGKESVNHDLFKVGFKFNQPPLSTPILLQHCLSYLLTARPQDRADYFKAIFELADIDTFRNAVEDEISKFEFEIPESIAQLEKLSAIDSFKSEFGIYLKNESKLIKLETSLKTTMLELLKIEDDTKSIEELSDLFGKLVHKKQSKAFPVNLFKRTSLSELGQFEYLIESIRKITQLETTVDDNLKQFVSLYSEIEKLQSISAIPLKEDKCPICLTENSLGNERIYEILQFLKTNKEYQSLTGNVKIDINKVVRILNEQLSTDYMPEFIRIGIKKRKELNFTINEIKKYVSDESLIKNWLKSLLRYLQKLRAYKGILSNLKHFFSSINIGNLKNLDFENIIKCNLEFVSIKEQLSEATTNYIENSKIIHESIQSKISAQTNTIGWLEIQNLSSNINVLKDDLTSYFKFQKKKKQFDAILKDIDQARSKVLVSKFQELSEGIKFWWNLLRPEERSYFESVMPRANAKRSIDFKIALQTGHDEENRIILDAVAIFSQSQINCLGLASFLAKMVDSKNSFIVLDDPILSVDDEHRAHFIHDAIKELIDNGIQLILLTQDQKTWSSIQDLYSYMSPSVFQLELSDPKEGTRVISKGDSAKSQLSAIKPLIRNKNSEIRKIAASKLRDAAERLCKEILVKERTKEGHKVSLTSFDKMTLEKLIPDVNKYLKDQSESGKLAYVKNLLNPGNHDDEVPSQADLSTAYGDLLKFEKDYCQ